MSATVSSKRWKRRPAGAWGTGDRIGFGRMARENGEERLAVSPPLCEVAEATGDSLLLLCRGSRGRERQSAGSKREGTDRALSLSRTKHAEGGEEENRERKRSKGEESGEACRGERSGEKQNSEIDRSRVHFLSLSLSLSLSREARGATHARTSRARERSRIVLCASPCSRSAGRCHSSCSCLAPRAFFSFFLTAPKSDRRRRRDIALALLTRHGRPVLLLEEPRHGPRRKPF